jgi:hypothetical protein
METCDLRVTPKLLNLPKLRTVEIAAPIVDLLNRGVLVAAARTESPGNGAATA